MDVVGVIDGIRQYFDVTVRHPLVAPLLSRSSAKDAAAASAGETQKRDRYPAVPEAGLPEVIPFAVETFGRLGHSARGVLQAARFRVAEKDPKCRGWVSAALQSRWLAQISCALAQSQYEAHLATTGNYACWHQGSHAEVPLAQVAAAWC